MLERRSGRRPVLKALAASAACLALPRIGRAASDKLVIGKSIATLLAYAPVDVGLANNVYRKHGLDLEVVAFDGSARLHQAMVAGSIDIALGSGATMSDVGKGEPSLCIAETLGPPADIAIIVPYDLPIETVERYAGPRDGRRFGRIGNRMGVVRAGAAKRLADERREDGRNSAECRHRSRRFERDRSKPSFPTSRSVSFSSRKRSLACWCPVRATSRILSCMPTTPRRRS